MWGGADREESLKAILACYDQGVTSIDTAPGYGKGLSEEIVGEALQHIPRGNVQVFTKFGLLWNEKRGELRSRITDENGEVTELYRYAGKESIIRECEDSLRRLGTDYIDLYQMHFPDNTTPIDESMEAVVRLLEQGKIRAAGVCNYNIDQMKAAAVSVALASNQLPYSMISRGIEKELIPYCMENGQAVIAFSPLQRGVLSGKIQPGHEFRKGDTRQNDPAYSVRNLVRINRLLDELRPLANAVNVSLTQLVIRWTLDRPGIVVTLVGARNAVQAIENARAGDLRLSGEDMRFVDRAFENIRNAEIG